MPMKFREADCVCENAGMDTYAIRTSTPARVENAFYRHDVSPDFADAKE